MKILDLFCGLKSLKPVCDKLGIEYYGIDFNNKFNPDMCLDINKLTKELIPFVPDVIWASPPCESFSVSSIGVHWNKDNTPKTERAKQAVELVKHTIDLIDKIQPKYYFMENPRGKLRKLYFMCYFPIRHTVTYCQYGDFRMKPTDIWTNNTIWKPRPMCKRKDPCHISAPRGSKTGTQNNSLSYEEKSKVPEQLLLEILNSCD